MVLVRDEPKSHRSVFSTTKYTKSTKSTKSTKVDLLVLQPPQGVPELEWAVYLCWTHNLHGGAMPGILGTVSSLRELEQFLDETLADGSNLETVDSLWDRYAAMNKSGYRYRTKYEPTRDNDVEAIVGKGQSDLVIFLLNAVTILW